MSARLPVVAIVGRANVGKSTLVNRVLGRREAIEHPTPGVTRDRQAYEVSWGDRRFAVVDTGGWEPRARGLASKVLAQAERAAAEADVIVFVVDAQVGITQDDLVVAKGLRKATTPVLIAANKVDSATHEPDTVLFAKLGLGEPFAVSALHGRASGDLLDAVVAALPEAGDAPPDERALSIAIVGRPNVGKSSLFNRLVGEERSIVHDLPGTTRDTVDTVVEIEGARYRFVDTAGMRRRARAATGPEFYGLVRSMRAIDNAGLALHVIDAAEGPTEQDQKIAEHVRDAGCAAVIVLNKWDLVPPEDVDDVADATRDELRFVPWATLVRTSALTGRGIAKLPAAIESARASWEHRVPTGALNSWLREGLTGIPLGDTKRARPLRIRYITQAGVRPPTFVVFANGRLTASAQRAIENRLRRDFGFAGTPIRIRARSPERTRARAST
ncbi:MAG TPA: ribosome biogenesis GTPase Der [Actinomycetota bacterium]